MERATARLLPLLVLAACPAEPPAAQQTEELRGPASLRVRVETGELEGVVEGELRAFRGIPYAAPPVGELRWRSPRPPLAWSGVRSAAAFGSVCPQLGLSSGVYRGDEDCLTLNVFTPAAARRHELPVMIWLHGGGSRQGSSSDPTFDAPGLAGRDVIVVTVNYRLGGLGRLALPAFGRDRGHIGNWGNLDELEAIRRVHRNIHAFGGDRRRVLIFGESSGAGHVGDLLASPEARGLFHAAAMESGLGGAFTVEQGYAISAAASAALGCSGAADEAACLRALPAETVVRATFVKGAFPPPLVDGTFLVREPVLEIEEHGSPVPLLIGSNRDEATTIVGDTSQPLTAAELEANLRAEAGDDAATQLLPLYASYATPQLGSIAFETDLGFTCPIRHFARDAARFGPVYRYLFTHALEASPNGPLLLAYHGSELPFVFGTLATADDAYVPTAAEEELAELMTGAWAAMAAHGRPHGRGLPRWPRLPALQIWDDTPSPVPGFHDAQCDIMDAFGLS